LIPHGFEQRNLIKVSGKTGIPVGVLGKGLTKQNLKELDTAYDIETGQRSNNRARSTLTGATSIRTKDETPEERRERKKLVKEYRKVNDVLSIYLNVFLIAH
jgi:protein LTV1